MPMGTALFYASRTAESTRPRRSCEGCWTYVLIGRLFGCDSTRRPRLERRSPGFSIAFYIDAEQAKVCNLHGRPETFDQEAFLFAPGRHGCYWRLGEIPQQAMGGD